MMIEVSAMVFPMQILKQSCSQVGFKKYLFFLTILPF